MRAQYSHVPPEIIAQKHTLQRRRWGSHCAVRAWFNVASETCEMFGVQPQQMLEMSPTRPPSGHVIESETCGFCCVTCCARGRTLQNGTRRGSSTCAIARRGPAKSKPSRNHSLQSGWIPTKHMSLPRPGPITRHILPTPPRRWWTTAKTTLELRRGRPERPVAGRRQSKTKHRQGEPRGARLCLRSGQKGCPLCDQDPATCTVGIPDARGPPFWHSFPFPAKA